MGFVLVMLANAVVVCGLHHNGMPFGAGFHTGLGLSCLVVRMAWWWAAREEEGA